MTRFMRHETSTLPLPRDALHLHYTNPHSSSPDDAPIRVPRVALVQRIRELPSGGAYHYQQDAGPHPVSRVLH